MLRLRYSGTPPYGYLGNTVTSLLRPFSLVARQKQPYIFSETLVNTVSSLSWPNFFGPLVTVLTTIAHLLVTCSNLICCKAGLNVGGKTTNIAFNSLVLQHHFSKQVVFVASLSYLELSPSYRPRCVVGRPGRKKKTARVGRWKKKKPLPSSPARFIFFDYCYFYWDTLYPSGASAEERVLWVNNAFTLMTCLNREAFCLRTCCTERLL